METVYDSIQNNDSKITGKHSLHPGTNNNGQLLIVQQARVWYLLQHVSPTQDIHKITWTPPDSNTSNQTDHALIDTGRACNSLVVRSYRGANCDSEHCLVPSNYRGRIKTRINKSNVRRWTPHLHTKWSSGENGTTNTVNNPRVIW